MTQRGSVDVIRSVGARVQARRREKGLTAKAAAEACGLSVRFYAQLEAGEANIAIGRLAAVADALDTRLAALVGGGNEAEHRAAHIALLGLRGAGKSTLGPMIAEQLGLPFVELTDRIEQAAGMDLVEIFTMHGPAYYRRLEAEAAADLVGATDPCVVALPGGLVHQPGTWDMVRRRCTTVWLTATPEDHMARVVSQGDQRPMVDRTDAMSELRALLASRRDLYAQSDLTLDTSAAAPAACLASLSAALA